MGLSIANSSTCVGAYVTYVGGAASKGMRSTLLRKPYRRYPQIFLQRKISPPPARAGGSFLVCKERASQGRARQGLGQARAGQRRARPKARPGQGNGAPGRAWPIERGRFLDIYGTCVWRPRGGGVS